MVKHGSNHIGSPAIGVFLALIGTFCAGLGNVFLRKSALIGESTRPWLQRKYYLLGTFCLAAPLSILNGCALAMAPLSLIAPTAGVTTIWSITMASCGFAGVREPLSRSQLASILLVIYGIYLVASSRGGRSTQLSAAQQAGVVGSFGFVSCWLAALAFGTSIKRLKTWLPPSTAVIATAFFAAMCAAISQAFLKYVATTIGHVCVEKSLADVDLLLLGTSIVGLITTPALNLYLLGETMASSSVLVGVGTYEGLNICMTATWGIYFFKDTAAYTHAGFVRLFAGLALSIVGVVVINHVPKPDSEEPTPNASGFDNPESSKFEEALPLAARDPSGDPTGREGPSTC
mmetsp:Transcript_5117/g.10008  ORF Transcript_5117/g.10008 Transcript_5117/m.10008 type:complete len:346 (-) Transcript_5117:118-1155(-)